MTAREPGDDIEDLYVAADGEIIDRKRFPLYAKVREQNDNVGLARFLRERAQDEELRK